MLRVLLFALICGFTLGCSGGGGGTVEGTVTLDGQPMNEGTVKFVRMDGQGTPVTATIAGGKFTAKLEKFEYKVEFSLPKVVGKTKMYDTKDSPTADVTKESIAEKFNVKTEFKIKMDGGTKQETYAITSAPK